MGDQSGSRGIVASVASCSKLSAEERPFRTELKNWVKAEKAACKIIWKVQPTSFTEERRRQVFDYMKRLIKIHLGAEVFSYGSVPLKTYLPDGDIDLTVFGGENVERSLAEDMRAALEAEERNMAAEFMVKDVQLISAEVKIVKCMVQNTAVDISFNQIGGLCSLCFLEQVDRLIGKDHLFKRSIILIKTWCYYESRILGASHGLISTYALEILVLYIIQLFHSKLDGPLSVLYEFLDYFGKFDWEAYGISLNGPVRVSSLPGRLDEMPKDSDKDLLLSGDLLITCVNMFSVPLRSSDRNSRGFQRKLMNIVDPLKPINNLGRSVSQGNFYRIRRAFSYGARKLAQVLLQPEDSVVNELHKFFSDTMARYGGGGRHDVQISDPWLTCNGPISSMSVLKYGGNNDFESNFRNMSLSPKSLSLSSDLNHVKWDQVSTSRNETPGSSNSLIDLTGDFGSYLQCLDYCKSTLSGHSLHMPLPPTTSNQNNNPRDNGLPPPHFMQNMFPRQHCSVLHPNPAVFPVQPTRIPSAPFEWREMPMPRGTGTYFLNMNQPPQSYRSPFTRGINQAPWRPPHYVIPSPNANYPCIQPERDTAFRLYGNASGTPGLVVNSRPQRVAASFPSTCARTQQSQPAVSSEQDSTRA